MKTKIEEEGKMKKIYFAPQTRMDFVSDGDIISTSIGIKANGVDWLADWSERINEKGQI